LSAAPSPAAADAFRLKDGDRVVLLGNTLIEREQRDGYWETFLTRLYPHQHIIFRNLGWSGDNVFGEAREEFGSVADGFRALKDRVLGLKPTVIFIAYGLNESFEGKAGLPHFVAGLNTLLDTLAPTKARIVLLSPLRHEDLGRPLPDPARHNRDLRLYCDALRRVADKRGGRFVDFYDLRTEGRLTDNGIHLTPYGYWRTALALEQSLSQRLLLEDLGLQPWQLDVDRAGQLRFCRGTRVSDVTAQPLRFQATDDALPAPPMPGDAPRRARGKGPGRLLQVRQLPVGKYILKIDGKPILTATDKEWAAGVDVRQGPEFDQVERLRRAIIEKNRLYFNRWRPQNDTYLFGFRKAEQGQNAVEVPRFDPLVERKEKEIAKLRVPLPHRYEIVPAAK
jgi:hypothetical protein